LYRTNIGALILENVITQVVVHQRTRLETLDAGLTRELIPATRSLASHALIISGIRRCGKSTLLMQMMRKIDSNKVFYLNFESPQLFEFSVNDFSRLDNIIGQMNATILFFDEIQLVTGWELYVRQKLDEGFRVVITGSNASLLGDELGTRLTGRHITQELFPFSFTEYLSFKNEISSESSFLKYLTEGGFPEYVKTGDEMQLVELYNDILIRDIVARYGIRDIRSLQRLAGYLMSNIANRITATKLKQPLSIGAASTILSWFSHFEQTWLFSFLPMFSYSSKARLINPRKVYCIDPGMVNVISPSFTDDLGRKLENVVYLYLRKKYQELFYFDENGECDFVAMKNGKATELVQVCWELTPDNIDRELNGLVNGLKYFKMTSGTIVTFNVKDSISRDGINISVVPAYQYMA